MGYKVLLASEINKRIIACLVTYVPNSCFKISLPKHEAGRNCKCAIILVKLSKALFGIIELDKFNY